SVDQVEVDQLADGLAALRGPGRRQMFPQGGSAVLLPLFLEAVDAPGQLVRGRQLVGRAITFGHASIPRRRGQSVEDRVTPRACDVPPPVSRDGLTAGAHRPTA